MRYLLPCLAASLLLVACGDEFDPASSVDDLRVLGIRAEPPEIALPEIGDAVGLPDTAVLSALVADPVQVTDPARAASVVYLSCTEDPMAPYAGVCTSYDSFRDVPAMARGALPPGERRGLGAVGRVTYSGLEGCIHGAPCASPKGLPEPSYAMPPELRLDLLPPGMPQRILGMEVIVVAVAIAASPEELLSNGGEAGVPGRLAELYSERDHVVAVKRLQLRGPDATDAPNKNPIVSGLAVDGAGLPAEPEEGPVLARNARFELSALIPPDAAFQQFTDYDAFGKPIAPAVEEWIYSFFSTAGELDRVHTREAEETNEYTTPDEAPPGGEAFFYLVVRDHRGGAGWLQRRVQID